MTNRRKVARVASLSDHVEVLTTGIRAKIKPVPAYLIDKMVSTIKDPKPPKQYIDSKGREEENPFDPKYLATLEENNRLRGIVTMEALILFGVELVDDLPPADEWLSKLEWLQKKGHLDLSEYDLEDVADREFVFKAFIAVSGVDLMKITMKSGMTSEEVNLAMDGFRRSTSRTEHQGSEPAPLPATRDTSEPSV